MPTEGDIQRTHPLNYSQYVSYTRFRADPAPPLGYDGFFFNKLGLHTIKKYPQVVSLLQHLHGLGKHQRPPRTTQHLYTPVPVAGTVRMQYQNFLKKSGLGKGSDALPFFTLLKVKEMYYTEPPTLTLRDVERPSVATLLLLFVFATKSKWVDFFRAHL